MRSARQALAAAAVAAVVVPSCLPAAAAAKLPATGRPFLVPNVGIGGAELGSRIFKGLQGWGTGGICSEHDCFYQDPRRPELGYGTFSYEDGRRGKITAVTIALGTRDGAPVFTSPLTSFRTPSGVRLGVSMRTVRRAFPSARVMGEPPNTYLVMRNGRGDTTLLLFASSRLVGVTIRDDRPRG